MMNDKQSVINEMRGAFWLGLKADYRGKVVKEWSEKYQKTWRQDLYREDHVHVFDPAMMNDGGFPPFIESQNFMILQPEGGRGQTTYLTPAAFIPGRDSETEARARAGAKWNSMIEAPVSDRWTAGPSGRTSVGDTKTRFRPLPAPQRTRGARRCRTALANPAFSH